MSYSTRDFHRAEREREELESYGDGLDLWRGVVNAVVITGIMALACYWLWAWGGTF